MAISLHKRLPLALAGAAILSLGTTGTAQAVNLTLGETWTKFYFTGTGSAAYSSEGPLGNPNDTTWNFSIGTGKIGILQVADAYTKGDIFSVFNLGILLGKTSTVPADGSPVDETDNPNIAFANPTYSSGTFQLGSGLHSLSLLATTSPFGGGAAYLRVVEAEDPDVGEPVPEPATILGTLAFGAMGLAARLRCKPLKKV